MSPRFIASLAKLFLSLSAIGIVTANFNMAAAAMAQSEPDSIQTVPDEKAGVKGELPIDEKIYRLLLRYEDEVSFFLPEGEFDAAFEKKFGHFVTLTQAHYNFLRGEMGFTLQNLYTKFRLVPQAKVYDRLDFVPLFSPDRLWRREQGVQMGMRVFFFSPIITLTSFNYQRFSFPSNINVRALESQQVHSVSQALGIRADSTRFLGFFNSGIFEMEFIHAFPFGSNRTDFWQLQISSRGASENSWITIEGEARWISLLDGHGVPPSFLGGRNRLSAYRVNEFSGINLLYLSEVNQIHLNKRNPLGLTRSLSMLEMNLVTHAEAGQVGGDAEMRDWSGYRASVGFGVSGIAAYRQRRAFEIFFFAYKALEHDRKFRYYFGVKY